MRRAALPRRTQPGQDAKAEAVALHEALLAMTETHRGPDDQTAEAHFTMGKVPPPVGVPLRERRFPSSHPALLARGVQIDFHAIYD